jgi:hypothetical protein
MLECFLIAVGLPVAVGGAFVAWLIRDDLRCLFAKSTRSRDAYTA